MKMHHRVPLIVFVCATLLSSYPALAQFSQQGPKLVGAGAIGSYVLQGGSVSISADGNTAIVGGRSDSNGAGAAWVWTRSGATWIQQGPKLVGSGAEGKAYQGASVFLSADGNTAIVGGYGDNVGAGAAWAWTRNGGVWTQQGPKLIGSGAVGPAAQGYSVALSADGDTAIVGGFNDKDNDGAAWVWTRRGGIWTQQGSKLVGSGAASAAQGASVSLSADGNTAIVGGIYDSHLHGAAWVWVRSGGVWTQEGSKLVGSDATAYAYQGASVSLSADGNTAIIGAGSDNGGAGAAWVWTRSGGAWTQQGTKLVGSGAVGNAYHGYSVSLSSDGNTALVGGFLDNGGAGAVWVWVRSEGVWTQQVSKLVGSGAVGKAYQGISVSLSADGNTAIVGGKDDNNSAGAAWVFAASAPPVAPTIITQPVSQTVSAGQNASFTAFAIGSSPLSYQWQFNSAPIAGATSATLTLNNVQPGNAGRYSVVAANSVGSVVSRIATLAVLANPTGGVPPPNPATLYPPVQVKQTAKDSLVVITHGWQPYNPFDLNPPLPDVSWIDRMADRIRANVPANWQVQSHDWSDLAWTARPDKALNNAKDNAGPKLGDIIASQNWSHVHLIGHSAGAALIQAAAERIQLKSQNPVVVHTTFLDAYVGITGRERSKYGIGADWSDSYFAHDDTDELVTSSTEGPLAGAFNVEVSWLDENKTLQPVYSSSANSTVTLPIPIGYQAKSTHEWPYHFYTNTIPPNNLAAGLGFPLSKEGGGWDNRGTYQRGIEPQKPGSMPVTVLTQGIFPVRSDPSLGISSLLSANSGNGTVQLTDKSFDFLTLPEFAPQSLAKGARVAEIGRSAWLSIGVPVTNKVNFVSFDAQFTSAAGAAGLLTVYWNTNQIGMVDESVTLAGWHSYTFALPAVFEAGHYALGFSLDPFTNVVSSVTVTNVSTGYAGLTNPIALSATNSVSNATPVLTLTADAGFNYLIQASTNLIDWTPFAVLLNTNGAVQFIDPAITNLSHRFYRALSP